MTIVRLQNCLDLLASQFEEFSRNILANQSFSITSQSPVNSCFFTENFFDNYIIRKKYLKSNFDKYIFVNLNSSFSDITSLDSALLAEVTKILDLHFENIKDLASFLENYDRKLIIFYSSSWSEELRLLMSLSFFLKDRLVFIFDSKVSVEFTNKVFYLELSDAFLNAYFSEIAKTFDLNCEKVLLENIKWDGDISQVGIILKEKVLSLSSRQTDIHLENASHEEQSSIHEEFIEESLVVVQEQNKESLSPSSISEPSSTPINTDSTCLSENIQLTPRETAVFEVLEDKKQISRQDLAILLWGDTSPVKDDAIDQFISRFRRKFTKAGYSKDFIQVKKGQGIRINNL